MEKHVGFEGEWSRSCFALLLYFGNIPYKGTVCEDTAECQSILGLNLKVPVCLDCRERRLSSAASEEERTRWAQRIAVAS